MYVDVPRLVDELKALRKGRGVHSSPIDRRVGEGLREVLALDAGAGTAKLRDEVAGVLRDLAVGLPDDLRIAVSAAFALDDDVRLPLYQERVAWTARRLDRDQRTARRRIDEGIVRLAELAIARHNGGTAARFEPLTEWHTAALTVVLTLDSDVPEALEFRTVVANRDDVRGVDLALTAPASGGPEISVLYGGTLARVHKEATDRYGFRLVLPEPLTRGTRHEFGLRMRVRDMRPYYACVPRHPCAEFDLRVRFAARPRRVVRLAGVFQNDAGDRAVDGDEVAVDAIGELRQRFHDLTPGLAYGVRWEP
ncbi:hypothetical protein [Saccharothrix violaceirubra]|uniref:Uncharacterized protein n=1 Tax=Saccharothrix violaceirubra TaxID=413306 RepID=A0A7W7T281_9PSEU|nr:hypothetical protein [Saccharothrix violaceirubra]MBB4965228.1 hypothetical protein [Saccharothrix violaceirubra]